MLHLSLNNALKHHPRDKQTQTHPHWLQCERVKQKPSVHHWTIPQSHNLNFYKPVFYTSMFILCSFDSLCWLQLFTFKSSQTTESSISRAMLWRYCAGVTQQDVLTDARHVSTYDNKCNTEHQCRQTRSTSVLDVFARTFALQTSAKFCELIWGTQEERSSISAFLTLTH